jgi:hypothetical protein
VDPAGFSAIVFQGSLCWVILFVLGIRHRQGDLFSVPAARLVHSFPYFGPHLELQSTILDGEIVRPTVSGRNVICRECCEPRYEPDHAATHALVHSLAEDASS